MNMTEEHYSARQIKENPPDRSLSLATTLDTIGLGLLLIWVGIAFWLDLAAWGLIGAGVITLGDQAARRFLLLKVDGNWVFVGVLLICAGFGQMQAALPLVPLVLILAGVAVIISLFIRKPT
jgi:putative Mn2+ efflux pump MntP